jgi:RNA polymerase sigma-70 factor (ECF subfamily)
MSTTALQDETLIARVDPEVAGPQVRAELTDRQLIERAVEGCDEAFEQIFDRYKRTVAHIAAKYFRRHDQIEEIIQISFAKGFAELSSFRGRHDASLGSWLARIAANSCLDHIRSKRRKPEELNCDLSQYEAETLLDLAASNDVSAEDGLVVRDLSPKLLSLLPSDDRALLQMLYADEMSVADIAALLGWSRSKVKIRAWRARNALRRVLRQYL